jgi:hypothetical protein
MAWWDVHKLQPLCDVVQQLQQAGLMGVDLLQTFVSHRIRPLQGQEAAMWVYLGSSCSDHSFSAKLDDVEIDT